MIVKYTKYPSLPKTGFAVHQMGVGGFGHKTPSPAGVFTAELNALFTALRHIAEVIRPPERCLILTVH
jgi:hypothetical protein